MYCEMITIVSLINIQRFFPFWGDSVFLYLDRGMCRTGAPIQQYSLIGTHKICTFDSAHFAPQRHTSKQINQQKKL